MFEDDEINFLLMETRRLHKVIRDTYNYVPFSGTCPICDEINPGKECNCKPGQYALTNPARQGKNNS